MYLIVFLKIFYIKKFYFFLRKLIVFVIFDEGRKFFFGLFGNLVFVVVICNFYVILVLNKMVGNLFLK